MGVAPGKANEPANTTDECVIFGIDDVHPRIGPVGQEIRLTRLVDPADIEAQQWSARYGDGVNTLVLAKCYGQGGGAHCQRQRRKEWDCQMAGKFH
jgi:hypothetical protein